MYSLADLVRAHGIGVKVARRGLEGSFEILKQNGSKFVGMLENGSPDVIEDTLGKVWTKAAPIEKMFQAVFKNQSGKAYTSKWLFKSETEAKKYAQEEAVTFVTLSSLPIASAES